ncbi:MAG: metal-dependent hydrolase, partial [Candidatus Hydrothermarchaeales archaeon]
MNNMPVKIIRSPRRKKTISARVVGGELVLYFPANMSEREEAEWIEEMKERMAKKAGRLAESDEELMRRAEVLNKRYFGG